MNNVIDFCFRGERNRLPYLLMALVFSVFGFVLGYGIGMASAYGEMELLLAAAVTFAGVLILATGNTYKRIRSIGWCHEHALICAILLQGAGLVPYLNFVAIAPGILLMFWPPKKVMNINSET